MLPLENRAFTGLTTENERPILLALRRFPRGLKSAATSLRRVQGVQCGVACVQIVRRVRHTLCDSL